jgi:hypothetical protein
MLAGGFTYAAAAAPAPTVTGLTPNSGPTAGGTSVTISGTNFVSGAAVTIGGSAATNVVVTNSTTITGVTPSHPAGGVTVIVTNPDGQSSALTNGYTYSTASPLEVVLLADDFNDNSLDASKWTANLFSGFTDTSLPIAEVNQRLEIGPLLMNTNGSHYAGLRSLTAYDFTNGYCYVQVIQVAVSSTTADAMLTVGRDVNGYYRIYVEKGSIFFQKRIGGAKTTMLTAAYDSTNDRYWRIRHDSALGKVVFETAPDNAGSAGTWAVRYTESWNTTSIPLSAVLFEMKAGTWQSETTAPGRVIFDDFKAVRQ